MLQEYQYKMCSSFEQVTLTAGANYLVYTLCTSVILLLTSCQQDVFKTGVLLVAS